MSHTLEQIHIPPGCAWILGERDLYYVGLDLLLKDIGCRVVPSGTTVHQENRGCVPGLVLRTDRVDFPPGSTIIKFPEDRRSSILGSCPANSRRGQISVPVGDRRLVVTWYAGTDSTPAMMDRLVLESEESVTYASYSGDSAEVH